MRALALRKLDCALLVVLALFLVGSAIVYASGIGSGSRLTVGTSAGTGVLSVGQYSGGSFSIGLWTPPPLVSDSSGKTVLRTLTSIIALVVCLFVMRVATTGHWLAAMVAIIIGAVAMVFLYNVLWS